MPEISDAPATLTSLSLRIKEGLQKDVGRSIARLDPADMKQLGLIGGDIIEIEGKSKGLAKVMPVYADERGKSIIQLDGILRDNSGAGLDEKVTIRKATCSTARRVVLEPISGSLRTENDVKYIASLLDSTPAFKGNRLRTVFFGVKPSEFRVLDTDPPGAIMISSATQFTIAQAKSMVSDRAQGISYEDIGGLGNQIQRIREMIELPLRYPELFERLGIRAPKGVLLFGPPGTGKTLIARAVASETSAFFSSISGPEIMGKLYGESEQKLRAVFDEAGKKAPSIIFIDEIDSIAPKREDMGSEKQVEKRVVAQLLALMDGLSSRGQVIVIAATNLPNAIDPALRRPGRFDREISIPIPDQRGRLEIMGIHTRGMPLAPDVSLERLAEITHGFVGADLEALAREAAMASIRAILPLIDFEKKEIPFETLADLSVTMDHFREALRDVDPSAIREFFVEVPNVSWEDVGGLETIKRELIEAIEYPTRYKEIFESIGAKPPKGILLSGPPGTGKTLLAKAAASQSGINFISVKAAELLSKFVGEPERSLREIFKTAKQAAPCLIFFDEIDALLPKRQASETTVSDRLVAQFLTEMDGIEELTGVVVLAATNRPDLLDEAVLRSGRFDLRLTLDKPSLAERSRIFEIHLSGKKLAEELILQKETLFMSLSQVTEGFTGADIEFVCRKATMNAVRGYLNGENDAASIHNVHLDVALKELKSSWEKN